MGKSQQRLAALGFINIHHLVTHVQNVENLWIMRTIPIYKAGLSPPQPHSSFFPPKGWRKQKGGVRSSGGGYVWWLLECVLERSSFKFLLVLFSLLTDCQELGRWPRRK